MTWWTTNFTINELLDGGAAQPAGSYGGMGFPAPYDGEPWASIATDASGNYWVDDTSAAALQKMEAIARTYGGTPSPFGGTNNVGLPVTGYTDVLYFSTPELITPSGYLPDYILNVYRFKAGILADFSDEGSNAAGGSTFYFLLYEIDDALYSQIIDNDTYNNGTPPSYFGSWDSGLIYSFIPAICSVTDSPVMGVNFGDYLPPTDDSDGFVTPSQYLETAIELGEVSDGEFELAWDASARWVPDMAPIDPDTPLKYNGGVSIVKVNLDRKSVV